MQTIKPYILLLITFLLLVGCKRSESVFTKGPGNMYCKIIDHNNGELIQQNNFVWLYYSAQTQEGKKVTGSFYLDNRPWEINIQPPHFKGDFFTGLTMLAEHDSAVFKISIDSLLKYKDIDRRPQTKGNYLQFTVKIFKVIAREKMKDDELAAKLQAENDRQLQNAKAAEPAEIKKYIAHSKLAFKQTTSGMYYYVNKQGAGYKAFNGDTVYINYAVWSLQGELAETNIKGIAKKAGWYDSLKTVAVLKSLKNSEEGEEEIKAILSKYNPVKLVIDSDSPSGLLEALKLFPKGTKCTLVIPSKFSYADGGHKNLAPYTPIRCDLEIVDVKSKKMTSCPDN